MKPAGAGAEATHDVGVALIVAMSVSGCIATFATHDRLISGDDAPDSIASNVAFYTLLPLLLAFDVVTAPVQYVYVITHAK